MSRKGIFSNLSPEEDRQALQSEFDDRPLLSTNRAKPMSAVSGAIDDLRERSRRADEIEKKLAEGQAVVDLDSASIEPSFVQDRMEGEIDGLLTSIREQGQQVPILVRPHPDQQGRYQVAFGHRRLRVLKELELPVKAVVRELSDEQLVIAQGQENNERQDLSFIEKARFADRLKDQFSRDVIISSLSVDRSSLSKMLSVVGALPAELVDAIGPAPAVGRRSWQDLVGLVEKLPSNEAAVEFARSKETQVLHSDERFKAVVAFLKPPTVARGARGVLSTPAGERLGQVMNQRNKLEITIDKKATPDFAAFVLEKLPALYQEHRAKDKQTNGE